MEQKIEREREEKTADSMKRKKCFPRDTLWLLKLKSRQTIQYEKYKEYVDLFSLFHGKYDV